ncbi:MAG: FAD-dependent oxidoreductase [Candidatus Hodarchaeales archaeon]
MIDACIIGAGISGTSIARELSKLDVDVLVIEKEADVSWGTTKANSGIVHAGYAATPGTLKARFNVHGNPMFTDLCKELDVPFKRNGTFVVALETDQNGLKSLEELHQKGKKNGVKTEIIVDKDKILAMEPNLNPEVSGILFAPTGGVISPYELVIALAENAFTNGIRFKLNTKVLDILENKDHFTIVTETENIKCRVIINAAGVHSDKVARMVGIDDFKIIPRRGEYVLFEKDSVKINHVLFPVPTKVSKGILASPTVEGHPFAGPNALEIDDNDDVSTTTVGIDEIISGAKKLIPGLPLRKSITNFAGVRAVADTNDFIIGKTKVANFINVAGIQSPGLSAAPAIGKHVSELVASLLDCKPKSDFLSLRKNPPVRFRELSELERDKLIRSNPDYAKIICRCELVTKAEVLAAIHRPLGAKTLDGLKFRTRARMGRCQGSFCTFRIMNILEEELGLQSDEITKKGRGSNMLIGKTKDIRQGRIKQ